MMFDPRSRATVRVRSRLAPAILGLVLVIQLIAPYRGWMMLLAGLGGAWLIGWVWAQALARNLDLERGFRYGWSQVGDRMEERFTLQNRGLLPAIWVGVHDRSTLPGYNASQVRAVGGQSEVSWLVHSICSRRGLFELGPTVLQSSDPLGFFDVEIAYAGKASMLVTPPVVPLPAIEVAAGGRTGRGKPRSDSLEQSVSAGGVKEYRPGDSLRWIHWPTTARTGRLSVRNFDGMPAGDWWIVLDLEARVQKGEGWRSTEEHGVILAASLADYGLRQGKAVGLILNASDTQWLPASPGEAQKWQIFRALALSTPGVEPVAQIFARAPDLIRHPASLIVITPADADEWLERLLPLVGRGWVPTLLEFDLSTYGAGSQAEGTGLVDQFIASRYVISSDVLDRPEARPGRRGRWEWRSAPSGRAVAVERPDNLSWRPLR